LYVVRGAGGFFVRERRGGRSTLAFDYRIVATPREERGGRLPPVTGISARVAALPSARLARSQQIPLPLSPEDRLKRAIGPRAYAKLIAALSKRFAALPSR
jgi:hypothetical protein